MARYDKVVRDRIPEIIEANGQHPVVAHVTGNDLVRGLIDKLGEEAEEFAADPCAEELADILEVVRALAAVHGIEWDQVEAQRVTKRAERGGFDRGLYLVEVTD